MTMFWTTHNMLFLTELFLICHRNRTWHLQFPIYILFSTKGQMEWYWVTMNGSIVGDGNTELMYVYAKGVMCLLWQLQNIL